MTRKRARARMVKASLLARPRSRSRWERAPLGGRAGGDKCGQRAGMAQGARPPLGEALLAPKGATLAGARVEARVGDDLVDPREARDDSQFGPDRGRALRANAGEAL